MQHAAHVAPVDPHAESHGGHDDVESLFGEGFLGAMPLLGRKPGVISRGLDAVAGEHGGRGLGVFTAQAVDNHGLAPMARDDVQRLLGPIDLRQDAIHQIRAIESPDQDGRFAQGELGRDVGLHPRSGRRGKRMQAGLREPLPKHGQLPILGPKIVSPVTDAMGFVDREPPNLEGRGRLQKPRGHQAFWRDEQQPVFACGQLCFNVAALVRRQAAVNASRRVAARLQPVDLILHQRDQRRNNDVGGAVQSRGNLITERLAAAGGHDHQRVAPGQCRFDGLGLQRSKRIESPIAPHHGENLLLAMRLSARRGHALSVQKSRRQKRLEGREVRGA